MKKLTALISALVLLLSFCACTDQAGGTPSESTSPDPTASQAVNGGPVQNTDSVETPSATPTEKTDTPEPSEEPSSAVSESPEVTSTPAPTPTVQPTQTPTSEPTSSADLKAIAIELSERRAPVSELYAAIGQPISSDYAPGCLEPDSEDGELIYDGFVVYTVRTATREYVYDVL